LKGIKLAPLTSRLYSPLFGASRSILNSPKVSVVARPTSWPSFFSTTCAPAAHSSTPWMSATTLAKSDCRASSSNWSLLKNDAADGLPSSSRMTGRSPHANKVPHVLTLR
jgi:hypothetical protein